MPKYLFVTGGVLSSLGKGLLSSSTARLLKSRGVNTSLMKIDPYLNCDAGTLNPFEHGEVFVTRDGFECDLDVGNYERFLNIFARREQNLMMGAAYKTVIEKERRGEFLGKTMQVIPHVTNEIKRRIRLAAEVTGCSLLVAEIGGTVGDIESEVVFEAVRQMSHEEKPGDALFVHLALLPSATTGEEKTKPLQHSVKALLMRGIVPDVVVARSQKTILPETRDKIALFCNVSPHEVFYSPDLRNVYELPPVLERQGLHEVIARKMGLKLRKADLKKWRTLTRKWRSLKEKKRVAVVGKYASMRDTYASVFEAIKHAALHAGVKAKGELVNARAVEKGEVDLNAFDAFVVPGGFGGRDVEGIISTIRFAREKNKPFLGLCYGLQLAVIEFARNVVGWKDAHSLEINPETKHPVICILPEKKDVKDLGGTLRLGAYDVSLSQGSKVFSCYKQKTVFKRFRHRYEVNPEFVPALEEKGLVFSGRDPNREIMKVLELPGKRFFVATQFHPEFDSRLEEPEPLFYGLLKAAKRSRGATKSSRRR